MTTEARLPRSTTPQAQVRPDRGSGFADRDGAGGVSVGLITHGADRNADRNDDEPSTTTFLITVVVSGDVEPGPVYQAVGAAPAAGSPSSTPGASSHSATATSPSATAFTDMTTDNGTAAPTARASPINSSGVPGRVWAGVAVLAAVILAALLLVRSRRRAAPSPGPD